MAFCVLSQYVDIEPGTTLGRVFDMVSTDHDLKRFLGEYCGCDIDAIHERPRTGGEPIKVIESIEKIEDGGYAAKGAVLADTVAITPFYYAYTDEVTGERRLDGSNVLYAQSSKNLEIGTSIHSQRNASFGFLAGLELRLDTVMVVHEADEDKQTSGEEDPIAFEACIRYTLLDVLLAIYEFFGEPPFDRRYQRQVEEDREFLERLRDSEGDNQTGGKDDGAKGEDDLQEPDEK